MKEVLIRKYVRNNIFGSRTKTKNLLRLKDQPINGKEFFDMPIASDGNVGSMYKR